MEARCSGSLLPGDSTHVRQCPERVTEQTVHTSTLLHECDASFCRYLVRVVSGDNGFVQSHGLEGAYAVPLAPAQPDSPLLQPRRPERAFVHRVRALVR